jgi:DNA mismatch repair ATPase MutS
VTTHYTDLEILEKDTKGKIKNYKFEISYNENKDIIFNYLIKEGISRQYIALELLEKNGFSDDIIIDAKNICSKIKNNKLHFIKLKSKNSSKTKNSSKIKKD